MKLYLMKIFFLFLCLMRDLPLKIFIDFHFQISYFIITINYFQKNKFWIFILLILIKYFDLITKHLAI